MGERKLIQQTPSPPPSLMCVNCSSCEHLVEKTDVQKQFYFYLITCNSCVPRPNLVFPVALIHLHLNYWLCWRAKNWGSDWSKVFRRSWPLYKGKENIKLINAITEWIICQHSTALTNEISFRDHTSCLYKKH